MEHCSPASERNDAGENLYMYEKKKNDEDGDVLFDPDMGDEVARMWYKEIEHWSFRKGEPKKDSPPGVHTGFFTAMIWRGVTNFGIGHCEFNGKLYIVARYYPHPNMPGEFLENISPPKEVTQMFKGNELSVRSYAEDEIITLLELKSDCKTPGKLIGKSGDCIRPSLKHSIKFKDWDDFKENKGEYWTPPTVHKRQDKSTYQIDKGPPLIAAYFNNKFGRISSSILRPVRPQYEFYRPNLKHDGKLVDELTYKRGDLIKFLGLTITGRVHYQYEPPKEELKDKKKKPEKLPIENLWRLGELINGEIGFYPIARSDCEGKVAHSQLTPMHTFSHEGPFHQVELLAQPSKPRIPWRTKNFEDHRRFDPKVTLKYDFMLVQNNYDPKMDGLFNPAMVDVFHEMRALDVVKMLRIKLDDQNLAVVEFRGRQRLVPLTLLQPAPRTGMLEFVEENNEESTKKSGRFKEGKMCSLVLYEINDEIIKRSKHAIYDDSKVL